MPTIHDRLTGGSIYNRQILGYMAESTQVEVHLDLVAEDRSGWPGGLWLVDSLCLESGASHLAKCTGARGVLIAHYLHTLDPRRKGFRHVAAESTMLRSYRAVVTTSRFARRALIAGGFTREVAAIPPGLAAGYRGPVHRSSLRRASPLRPAIVTVASILPDKGLLEMLRGLRSLSGLDWTWEIIGDVELDAAFSAEFRDCVSRSSLCDRITIRGALSPPEVINAYDCSDVFALPSHFETCSMATMEAMARGLPVIAFRVGGLPDLLPEVSRQALVETGDAAGWVEALRRLLVDGDYRQRLGVANRRASLSFPSWEECGSALESFLTRL
jgi:hypothetical protein